MDDVSSFSINYNFIRMPKKKTNNILSYAAEIYIEINGNRCLEDNDFAILDFALSLREWRKLTQQDLYYCPMDDDTPQIRFIYEKNKYLITLSQYDKVYQFQVAHSVLIDAIDRFLNFFDNDLKKQKDCLSRYNYSI